MKALLNSDVFNCLVILFLLGGSVVMFFWDSKQKRNARSHPETMKAVSQPVISKATATGHVRETSVPTTRKESAMVVYDGIHLPITVEKVHAVINYLDSVPVVTDDMFDRLDDLTFSTQNHPDHGWGSPLIDEITQAYCRLLKKRDGEL